MERKNNKITIHRCIFAEQARKVKEAIVEISKKDSLYASDTQAIRKLTEVYDVLSNPVQENEYSTGEQIKAIPNIFETKISFNTFDLISSAIEKVIHDMEKQKCSYKVQNIFKLKKIISFLREKEVKKMPGTWRTTISFNTLNSLSDGIKEVACDMEKHNCNCNFQSIYELKEIADRLNNLINFLVKKENQKVSSDSSIERKSIASGGNS